MRYRTFLASVMTAGLLASPALAAGETTAESTQLEGTAGTTADTAASGTTADTAAGGAMDMAQMDMTQVTQDEETVRSIQQALQEKGYDLEVDGMWGESTQQALMQFQQEQGLEGAGELTPDTLAALEISGADVPQAAEVPTDEAPASPTQPAQ